MAKLPDPVDNLDAKGKEVYEYLLGPRDVVSGMYRTLLNNPELAEHVSRLGTYIRYGSKLPGDLRELAILATARNMGAAFIWEKHVKPAQKAGLPDDVIAQVSHGDLATAEMKDLYLWTWQLAQHVVHHDNLPEKLQNNLTEVVGTKCLLEMVAACALYRFVSSIVFSFDVDLPEDGPPPF